LDFDVIFDESRNFNRETMVSRFDFGLEQMVKKSRTKDGR
jgi:hypothetical protein